MERQAWKLIVLLLLFCYVHSPYVKAQVGNGKQITMEFKNEGLPSIFKRLQKLSGYKVLLSTMKFVLIILPERWRKLRLKKF